MIKLYRSLSNDIRTNLAIEACLIDQGREALFLWQNDSCVVIGAHQDPCAECNLALMKAEGVALGRRPSGGGAVYQDMGNACFTYISPSSRTFKSYSFGCLLKALSSLGLDASLSGRNDVIIDSRKVSGSAFENRGNTSSHHATMLINTDIGMIGRYLTPSKLKLQAHCVQSVQSRVATLSGFDPSIDAQMFFSSLSKAYGCIEKPLELDRTSPLEGLESHLELFFSDEWIFGKTPRHNAQVEVRTDEGIFTFLLEIDGNEIAECKVYSDCLDEKKPLLLEKKLRGCAIADGLDQLEEPEIRALALKLGI